jgi:hypothetical protein
MITETRPSASVSPTLDARDEVKAITASQPVPSRRKGFPNPWRPSVLAGFRGPGCSICREVEEYLRKQSWSERHDPRGPEEDAWLRGTARIAGTAMEGLYGV